MQPTSVWRCSFLDPPPEVLLRDYLSLGPSRPKKLKSCSAVLPSYLGVYSHSGRTFMTYILCWEFCKPETVLGYEPHWHLRGLPIFPRWRAGLVRAQTHGRDGGSRGLAAQPPPSPAHSQAGGSSIEFVEGHRSQIHFPTLYIRENNCAVGLYFPSVRGIHASEYGYGSSVTKRRAIYWPLYYAGLSPLRFSLLSSRKLDSVLSCLHIMWWGNFLLTE